MFGIEQYTAIVGLLSAFTAGRDASKALGLAEFNAWLTEHSHSNLTTAIEQNAGVAIFIKAYLNRELPQIQTKLDALTSMIEMLVERSDDRAPVGVLPGELYAKNVALLFLGRAMEYGHSANANFIIDELGQILDQASISYRREILSTMVEQAIFRKNTASTILETFWGELIER
jgi:hypothetical protein